MSSPSAFETCAREIEEASARASALPPVGKTMAQFHGELLDERAQAISEGRWFYGYRADKETYAEFQKRALAEIERE